MKYVEHFLHFPFFIKVLFGLCIVGALFDGILFVQDIKSGNILWHLHGCFLLLYATQAIFIWLKEPWTAILTVLQGIVALITTSDFIFFPILKVIGLGIAEVCDPSIQVQKVYEYVFVSLSFTLQMMSAFYLWATFRRKRHP